MNHVRPAAASSLEQRRTAQQTSDMSAIPSITSKPPRRPSYESNYASSTSASMQRSTRLPMRSSSATNIPSSASAQASSQQQLSERRTSRSGIPAAKSTTVATAASRAAPTTSNVIREPSIAVPRSSSIKYQTSPPVRLPTRSTSRGTDEEWSAMRQAPSQGNGTLKTSTPPPKVTPGLRRKPSTIQNYAASKRTVSSPTEVNDAGSSSHHIPQAAVIENVDSGFPFPEAATNEVREHALDLEPKSRISPEPAKPPPISRDVITPVPQYAPSATPTTRYTDSPFSHVPTPSSASSYSSAPPVASSSALLYPRQLSPVQTRPTPRSTAMREQSRLALAPVRESSKSSRSSASSASNPTARSTAETKPTQAKPASAPPASDSTQAARPSSRGKLVKNPPQRKPSVANKREPGTVPPELAHLNVEPSKKPSPEKSLPPPRPSRDGTPNLESTAQFQPIVQSDLPRLYTTYHKRTPSQEAKPTPTVSSPSLKSRLGLSSKSPSKNVASPRVDSAVSSPPTTHSFTQMQPPPTLKPTAEKTRIPRKDSPAVATAPSPAKTSRFALFHRKNKEESKKPPEKPRRVPSKGPTAGTGHEGYGRFNARTQQGSIASSSTSSFGVRSASTDSVATSHSQATGGGAANSRPRKGSVSSRMSRDSSMEMSEFLRERLSPVVLRGSGSTASSSKLPRSTVPDSSKTSLESNPDPRFAPATMSGAIGGGAGALKTSSNAPRQASIDSSADEGPLASGSALANRRSMTRLSTGKSKSPAPMPAPIKTALSPQKASIDSYDASASAGPQNDTPMSIAAEAFGGREGMWLRPMGGKQKESDARSPSKWNFVQRAHGATPPMEERAVERAVEVRQAPAEHSLRHQHPANRVAHYPMADPIEPVGLEEIERIANEYTSAEESMSESYSSSRRTSGRSKFGWPERERRQTKLLPSPPVALARGYSSDSADYLSLRPPPPNIMFRVDSNESTEVLSAQTAVLPAKAPTVVNIQRSPSMREAEKLPSPTHKSSLDLPARGAGGVRTPEPNEQVPAAWGEPTSLEASPARQPRLSPVGRIPKVVSKRDRERQLSENSFSRPFVRSQPKIVKPPGSLYSQIRELASPDLSLQSPPLSNGTRSDGFNGSGEVRDSGSFFVGGTPLTSESETRIAGPGVTANHPEFFYMPRNNSDVSYSSSSGTLGSLFATAPPVTQQPLIEDVWNEYDDFLDDVLMRPEKPSVAPPPMATPLSTASSLGHPFQYSSMLFDYPISPSSAPAPLNWTHDSAIAAATAHADPTQRAPSTSNAPMSSPDILSVPTQIARFMQPSLSTLPSLQSGSNPPSWAYDPRQSTTSTLFSNGDRLSGLSNGGDRLSALYSSSNFNRTSVAGLSRVNSTLAPIASERGSVASSGTNSQRASGSAHSRSASLPEGISNRPSQSSLKSRGTRVQRVEEETDMNFANEQQPSLEVSKSDKALTQTSLPANLRFAALMTSKWLSRGRVLVSPAHHEMRLADEPRVLILDGLGSDWSYYVALSYPAAFIYSMGPLSARTSWPGTSQPPPKNHKHISHPTLNTSFPFPKGMFTAVCFRFPAAASDDAYRFCLSECKRVLRPGGHLEVVALDLDMEKMGSRARQAVRGLKTRLQQRDPNVSLKNLSDALVRLVGRCRFEELQRCVVGVPAAGRIPRSGGGGGGAASDGESSGAASRDAVISPRSWLHEEPPSARFDTQDFSFADLLVDDARANQMDAYDVDHASQALLAHSPGPQILQQSQSQQLHKAFLPVQQQNQQQAYTRQNRRTSHDEAITKTMAKVGRLWYSSCYEKSLLPADQSIWNDEYLLRECEKQGTTFRVLVCYAQKPVQGRRRTASV